MKPRKTGRNGTSKEFGAVDLKKKENFLEGAGNGFVWKQISCISLVSLFRMKWAILVMVDRKKSFDLEKMQKLPQLLFIGGVS